MDSTPLALLYGIAQEDERMLEYIKKIEIDPNNDIAWNRIGEILADNYYYSQAIFTFDKAIEINRSNLEAWVNKGKVSLTIADYDNALECFSEATEISHSNIEAWINRGRANSGLGDHDEAIKCYDEALRLGADDGDLYLQMANSLYYLSRYDEALEYYRKSIDKNPDLAIAYVNMGLTRSTLGDFKGAEEDYLTALELDGQNISATRYLSYLYTDSLYLFEKALPLCQRLYDQDPNAEYTTYLAETLLKTRSYSQSRYYSNKAIKLASGGTFYEPLNKFFIVCSYFLEGNLGKGRIELDRFLNYLERLPQKLRIEEDLWVFEGLKKAIEYSKADSKITNCLLMLIRLVQGRENNSEKIRTLAIEIEKTSVLNLDQEIRKLRGNLVRISKERLDESGHDINFLEETVIPQELRNELESLQDSRDKLDRISQALKLDISYDTGEDLDLAYLMTIEGRYEQALDIYDRILSREPENTKALISKGIALYRLGNYHEANNYYDEALKIEPNDISTIVEKGLVLGKLGKEEDAKTLYARASELKPHPGDFDGFLNKGIALEKLGRYHEALPFIDKALESKPKHDRALVIKGIALDNLRNYEEATAYYDKALEINPNSVLALYNKACSLSLQGKGEDALDYLQKAIKLDPQMKNQANFDNDFRDLRANKRFKLLVA